MVRRTALTLVWIALSAVSPALAQPVRDTLFLTWADDPTSTMLVQWLHRGRAPQPATLRVWPDAVGEASATTHAATVAPFHHRERLSIQRVALRNLHPDTLYAFEASGGGPTLRFRTAPATLERPLVFAAGGDVGTGPAVDNLHRQAAAWEPLFGLVCGDIAYAHADPDTWTEFLRLWHRHMRGRGDRLIPLVAAIGNHEVDNGFGKRVHAPAFYALFGPLFPHTGYAALDFGDYLSFLLLDSNHTTPVHGEQTAWLKQALADRRDRQHLVPVYHVPMYPSVRGVDEGQRGAARLQMRDAWLPLFEAANLKVALEHDDHAYKRTHPLRSGQPSLDGTVFVGDGAWGRSPKSVDADRPYLAKALSRQHVLRITLHPDGRKSFLAVDPKGDVLDRFDVE